MSSALINLTYVVASALFIFGLKKLSHPRTAVRGNLLGALGMLLAILATLVDRSILDYKLILVGVIVGSGIGAVLATKTPMTAMPQMVGMLNGFGGGASVLVAGAVFLAATAAATGSDIGLQLSIATAASGLIGAVTFTGSMIAFAKLQEIAVVNRMKIRNAQWINLALGLVCVGIGALMVIWPAHANLLYWVLVVSASVLGVTLVVPVGGADMPVVICLLNSYSGLAGAATGFVINNSGLIIAGSLVGASGVILTKIMCDAMNRSLMNVLLGTFGPGGAVASADEVYAGKVKSTSPEEVAMLFDGARRVVIVPGYGLAVSQAQHVVRDLANLLEARGTEVEFGIHPVAGRMPGHMNVLLAEADVSYDKLKEMDEINPSFAETDVVLVIGANDVVNPEARTNPNSPIAGMPILDVDKARTVVVVKRSLSPGFAGIPNPLFAADNALMMFGDGKKAMLDLVAALKES